VNGPYEGGWNDIDDEGVGLKQNARKPRAMKEGGRAAIAVSKATPHSQERNAGRTRTRIFLKDQ